jgi:hypothetical protein
MFHAEAECAEHPLTAFADAKANFLTQKSSAMKAAVQFAV